MNTCTNVQINGSILVFSDCLESNNMIRRISAIKNCPVNGLSSRTVYIPNYNKASVYCLLEREGSFIRARCFVQRKVVYGYLQVTKDGFVFEVDKPYDVVVTDTFAGEPNFCWRHEYVIQAYSAKLAMCKALRKSGYRPGVLGADSMKAIRANVIALVD